MPLSDVVTISITTDTATQSQAGFGVPLILSPHTLFADLVRYYTDVAGLVTDGFTTATPEYKAASKLFAQNPRPPRVGIGKLALRPTQRWAVTPTVLNSTVYSLKVNGTTVSYTSDASATATEIIGGLKTAIDALGLAITTSDQTTYLRIVANAAGAWFQVESLDVGKLGVAQDHADPGVATDLAALVLADNDWYAVLNLYNSAAMVTAIAAWVETNKKLFIAQSQDSDILTGSTTDIASTLQDAAYARTAVIYHPDNGAFVDAAWAGKRLPDTPGSETWKFAQLATVTAASLTPTQRNNAKGKDANVFYAIEGRNITSEGVTSAGEFIDIIRARDWLEARIGELVYGSLTGPRKLPYTDVGVAIIAGQVRAALLEGVANGFLSAEPPPNVIAPKVADVSGTDRANRHLPNVRFDAIVQGAVHTVAISGTVSAA
jgi:hypothetical protein